MNRRHLLRLLFAPFALASTLPAAAQPGRFAPGGARDAAFTVRGWYQRYLGREPDAHALGWIQALRQGQDPTTVLSNIVGSDEYYNRNGGTPQGFVRGLYRDLVGRPPSPREEGYWVRQVYFQSRPEIAVHIMTNPNQQWDPTPDPYDYRPPYYRYR